MPKKDLQAHGVIDVTRRGVGYLPHEDLELDIEIPHEELNTALNGDEVRVAITSHGRGKRTRGTVIEIIKRAREAYVGTLKHSAARGFEFISSDPRFYPKLRIPPEEAAQATEKDKVIVRITRWVPGTDPVGAVIEVIGTAGAHETEMRAAVLARGMSIEFPKEVEYEAEALNRTRGMSAEEIARRRDFRAVTTFTIDPDDAKDFDDALSVRKISEDTYEIGVHIADVTHYVRPNTALDREARTRGTSIYLVDRTIPMLPEVLSNDLCSLRPNEDRLTFSAVFTVDMNGRILERWFGKSIIHSNRRFTYREAQQVLDGNSPEYKEELETLATIGKKLRRKREQEGALSFDTDEVKFELDEHGKPVRAYVKERLETMRVIEDWMLLANQEVAQWVSNHVKGKKPAEQVFIYRIHDSPDQDRLEELRIFLKAVGYDLGKEGRQIESRDIDTLLRTVRGTQEEAVIQMATLRSMAKAVYSHKNIGHFSLSFKHYTHFTSPIRRYPDMMVHRILASHLHNEPLSTEELAAYQRAALAASEREVAAVEAERESIKYKQVEFMTSKIGTLFEGTITGVTEHGLYIAEKETRAEGFVHVSLLQDDYYDFKARSYSLVGSRTKKAYRMGDRVQIKLLRADLESRQIEWGLE